VSTRFFCVGWLSNGGRERNEIWHKSSLWWGRCPNFEYAHSAEKSRDTTLNAQNRMSLTRGADQQIKIWLTAHISVYLRFCSWLCSVCSISWYYSYRTLFTRAVIC